MAANKVSNDDAQFLYLPTGSLHLCQSQADFQVVYTASAKVFMLNSELVNKTTRPKLE